MVRKDGTILPVLLNSTAVKDSSGNFVMSRTTIFDITDRKTGGTGADGKRGQAPPAAELDRRRPSTESTSRAIARFCNPACLRLLGYGDAEELLGKNMHVLIHHSRADGSPFPVEECRIFQAFQKGEGTHATTKCFGGPTEPVSPWNTGPIRNGAAARSSAPS